jgi:hypothetical protein
VIRSWWCAIRGSSESSDGPESGERGSLLRRSAGVNKLSVAFGVLLVLFGVLFGLQGLGVVGGSVMSGKTVWAVLGPLIALAGVVLVVRGAHVGRGR